MPGTRTNSYYAFEMSRALSEVGYEVTLMVPIRKSVNIGDPFAFFRSPQRFVIRYVSCIDLVQTFGSLGSRIQYASFIFFVCIKMLFADRKQIIYTREPIIVLLLSFLRFTVVFEAVRFNEHKRRHLRFIKRAKVCVTTTMQAARILSARGFKRVVYVPNGVNIRRFEEPIDSAQARKQFNLPVGRELITYIGDLSGTREIETLYRAAQRLREDAQIVLIGGSAKDVRAYRSRVTRERVSNVIFYGALENRLIPDAMRASDGLVLLNQRTPDERSWGRLFEYMASGVPIIAFDTGPIKTVLSDSNALLVPEGDPSALAGAIEDILRAPQQFASIAQQAKRDVGAYTWQARALKIKMMLQH